MGDNRGKYKILDQVDIPLLRITKDEKQLISEAHRIEAHNWTMNIEYCPEGLPVDDLNKIKKNYYIKSIHSFVFKNPINNRRIFEVEPKTAIELEYNFEQRLKQTSLRYFIISL